MNRLPPRPLPILLLLSTTVLGACAHAPATEPAPARPRVAAGEAVAPFFPLAKGNRWRYRGHFPGQQVDQEIRILGRDGRWWVDSTGQRYAVDAEGLRSPERYLLKAPLAVGTRWKAVVSVSSTEHYEITETGVTASEPAGRFEGCVRVVARNRLDDRTTLFKEDTYCPRVGLVRLRTWMDVAGKGEIPQVRLDLVEYHLAGEGR